MITTELISQQQDKNKLPDGWRWVKLGELSRIVSGGTPPRGNPDSFRGTIPWVKTLDLNCDVVEKTEECISESAFAQIRGELLPVGTVMIAMYGGGGTIGKSGILGLPATTNQAIGSILPNPDVFIPEFLHAWLLLIRPEWMRYSGGNRRDPNINKGVIERMKCPLPPLDEQKQIVAILNEQMEAVVRSRQATLVQLEAAIALPAAYFRSAFHGITPLTVNPTLDTAPPGWKWKLLSDLARLESGHTPSREHSEWWGGDIPWLSLADIRELDGKVVFETKEYTNEDGIANSSARVLPAGTVALSRTASVGFITILGRPMATSQDFVNWVCGSELDSHFLAFVLRASHDYICSVGSGAVHKTVYVPTVKAFRVCIPPLPEQKRILMTLTEQLAEVEHLQKSLKSQLNAINKLPATLLRRAFYGEL